LSSTHNTAPKPLTWKFALPNLSLQQALAKIRRAC
jgi:hypothetical protein